MSYSNKKWYKPTKLKSKIIIVIALLFFIRLLSNIPVPFINREYLAILFADSSAYGLLNTFSGGSFTNMTFMALGVTPYISASIILQLLCVTFPRLKDIQRDGQYGKNRWKIINILTGIALGVLQSIGVAITLGRSGLFTSYTFGTVAPVCLLWILGGTITILIGEYISKFCIGNGISLILAANIIAELPGDILTFWQVYITNKTILNIVVAVTLFALVTFGLIIGTVILNGAQKEIPIVYARNANAQYQNKSILPMKLNAAGVMPIIFTSTLFSMPLMFISSGTTNKVLSAIYQTCSNSYRYSTNIYGMIGLILDFILVIAFAYFYTAITFNPTEIANKLKKKGATIPGIRPGKPTEEYLYNKNKRMTFIGAVYLFVLTQIPTLITCTSNIRSLSFGGTSVIIIVGVVLETALIIKSELLMKSYAKNTSKQLFGMKMNKGLSEYSI